MNVGATVHVEEVASGTKEVYETSEVYNKSTVDEKIKKVSDDVTTNKSNIAALNTSKANADTVYTKDQTYTKDEVNAELNKKANADTVYTKDQTYTKDEVNTELSKKASADTVYTKDQIYTKNEVNTELGKKANADTVYTKDQTYTKDEVNTELGKKANADNVYTKEQTYTKTEVEAKLTEAGTSVDTKLADVNTELDKKADKSTTLAGYGIADAYTKGEVDTKLGEKADKSTTLAGYGITDAYTKEQTDEKLAQKANASDVYTKGDIDTKMGNVYTKTEVDGKLADEVNARNTAITDAIARETQDRTNAITAAINGEVTERNKAISDAINLEVTNRDAAITNAKTDLQGKITAEETARKEKDNELEGKITANTTAINNEATARATEDAALSNRIGTVDADGKYIKKSGTNNISENLKVLDSQVDTNAANIKANADAIAKEKSDREAKDTELDGKITSTDAKLTQEIQDRKDADVAINTKIGTIDDTRTTYVKDGQSISQNLTKLDEELVKTNGRTAGIERDAANERTIVKDDLIVKKDLTVEGTIHADKITFGSETNNQTAIDKGTISSKNDKVQTDGISKKSSLEFDESKFEVGVSDKDSNGHFIMDADKTQLTNRDLAGKNLSDIVADKDKIKTTVKDENGNVSSIKESASEINHYVEDKDKNWSTSHQDATGASTTISNKDGSQSTKTEQNTTDITNTAKAGTITNDAKDIVNRATNEITNEAGTKITDKVGDNTRVTDTGGIKDSVGTDTSREMTSGKITDAAGDSTVTTENGTGTTFSKAGNTETTNIYGDTITTGTVNAKKLKADETTTGKLTAGVGETENGTRLTVNDDGVKGSFKSDTYTSKSYILKNTLKSGVDNGKEPTEEGFVGSRTDHYMDGDNAKLDETVKDAAGSNVTQKMSTSTTTTITDTAGKTTSSTMTSTSITNNAAETITNEAGTSITNKVGNSKVTTDANGTTFENATTAVTDGGHTTTNINGNKLTTGALESNMLKVGGKKGDNEANLTVDPTNGINSSVTDGNTTNVSVDNATLSNKYIKKDNTHYNGTLDQLTKSTKTIQNGEDVITETKDVETGEVSSEITKDGKSNKVTSTVDGGTKFTNTNANTAIGEGTITDTTIKGNTITTGKVTMDYAEVMKDLGVHGNATVDKNLSVKGNTTLGEAGKDTTLTVNSKATFNEESTFKKKATFKDGAEVENGLTVSSGGMNVTGESTFHNKVTMEKGLDVTGGVSSDSFTVKGTDIKIDSSGINAGGKVISNVADGSISEGSKDAVNGGQLYRVKNDLEGKVNKVGANAAAMANLHPMEFDPDSKWNIAAAMGNYGSETATAMGLFYRPNEDVMVNLSTAFGTGENMVGGGVSVRLGQGGNKATRKENSELKAKVDDLTARMDALLSVLNPNMSKDFPDVPENHWAYEAVSRLAGNDIIQGYPDGEFHGDRTMTRYEMAEIIYNALSRGASAEKKLVEEFKPELQALAASNKATADAPAEKAEG